MIVPVTFALSCGVADAVLGDLQLCMGVIDLRLCRAQVLLRLIEQDLAW